MSFDCTTHVTETVDIPTPVRARRTYRLRPPLDRSLWTSADAFLIPEHRRNLALLADHLWSLPPDYEGFSMRTFYEPSLLRCGAVACAIGHGPRALDVAMPDVITPSMWHPGERNWDQFSERYFGMRCYDGASLAQSGWAWCFSDEWTAADDTPGGAAVRIRILLDHGLPELADWENVLDNFSGGDLPYEVLA